MQIRSIPFNSLNLMRRAITPIRERQEAACDDTWHRHFGGWPVTTWRRQLATILIKVQNHEPAFNLLGAWEMLGKLENIGLSNIFARILQLVDSIQFASIFPPILASILAVCGPFKGIEYFSQPCWGVWQMLVTGQWLAAIVLYCHSFIRLVSWRYFMRISAHGNGLLSW